MDNDPSQRSKAARKAINEAGATLFAIPPRSPDLNPIENLFHIVKNQLNKEALTKAIHQETWQQFSARVHKTILQIPISFIIPCSNFSMLVSEDFIKVLLSSYYILNFARKFGKL